MSENNTLEAVLLPSALTDEQILSFTRVWNMHAPDVRRFAKTLHRILSAAPPAQPDALDARTVETAFIEGFKEHIRLCEWGHPAVRAEDAWADSDARRALTTAPAAQHPDDAAVDALAAAMKAKLAKKRDDGRGGWEGCNPATLSDMLREHIDKGDPIDVANFCMMLFGIGARITPARQPISGDVRDAAAARSEKPGRDVTTLYPATAWHEDDGDVLWHRLNEYGQLCEAPVVAHPLSSAWDDEDMAEHTHWSRLPFPDESTIARQAGGGVA